MTELCGWKSECAAVLVCAATAITASARTFKILIKFDGTNGARPHMSLVQGRGADLYGTTESTVFKMKLEGGLTTLHSFDINDGYWPPAGLVLSEDGNFYGTTQFGDNNSCFNGSGCGTVFKISPGGKLTTLHSFCAQPGCTDGYSPGTGLTQATDGTFYGTTNYGGNVSACNNGYGCGTIFKISPGGKLTTLHSFCSQPNCADGYGLGAALVQATDGNFYGTTLYGGNVSACNNGYGCGTIFKISPGGKLTTLHSFCSQASCVDGSQPGSGVIQASDGSFYGSTMYGGDLGCLYGFGCGTIFKVTRQGKLTTLYTFNYADGQGPNGLVQATDRNFYGTTFGGGAYQGGTIFKFNPRRGLTTLHTFCVHGEHCNDGGFPVAALLQATNGTFYGSTWLGGDHVSCRFGLGGCGLVFSLDTGLGPFVTFVRDSSEVGQTAQILGQGFTGTTGVSFNGTTANFVVHSNTYLTATVPQGATTGYVVVATPSRRLQSNVVFRVRN